MFLRDPADVPAPVAIALADFCRRADRPAPGDEVRQALARLSPDEDSAVLRLCRGEPPARPLSPHAAIDVVRGLAPAEAARREEAGAYAAVAAEAARAAQRAAEAEAVAARAAGAVVRAPETQSPAPSPFAPDEATQRERLREAVQAAAGNLDRAADALGLENAAALRRVAGKLGVLAEILAAEEAALAAAPAKKRRRKDSTPGIHPIRRPRAEVEARRSRQEEEREAEEEPAVPAPRPGRRPAAPTFGRYVAGPAVRRPFSELEEREGVAVIEGLVADLHANRRLIVERLGALYARDDRRPVSEADFARLLSHHGLTAWFEKLERENLRVLLRQNRAHLPSVGRVLRLELREVQRLIRRFGLEAEVRELEERVREEARKDRPLPERIAFAAEKEGPLRDAGVLEEVDARNLAELRPALEAAAAEGVSTEPTVVVELARRALGIEPRIWRKALRRYRLVHLAASILGVPPPEEPRASRTSGGVERATPARSHLPVRRAGALRREVPVVRIGETGAAERRQRAGRFDRSARAKGAGRGGPSRRSNPSALRSAPPAGEHPLAGALKRPTRSTGASRPGRGSETRGGSRPGGKKRG